MRVDTSRMTILKQCGILKSKINKHSLVSETVKDFGELAFWEKRLTYLGIAYVIARLRVSKTRGKCCMEYGIFSDPIPYESKEDAE